MALESAYEIRREAPFPAARGMALALKAKRILLWSEQGIGDTINWASCLPLVASLAKHTILECPEKIVVLLARSFPNIEVRPEDRSMDSKRDDFIFTSRWEACIVTLFHTSVKTQISMLILSQIQSESNLARPPGLIGERPLHWPRLEKF